MTCISLRASDHVTTAQPRKARTGDKIRRVRTKMTSETWGMVSSKKAVIKNADMSGELVIWHRIEPNWLHVCWYWRLLRKDFSVWNLEHIQRQHAAFDLICLIAVKYMCLLQIMCYSSVDLNTRISFNIIIYPKNENWQSRFVNVSSWIWVQFFNHGCNQSI